MKIKIVAKLPKNPLAIFDLEVLDILIHEHEISLRTEHDTYNGLWL